MAWLGGFGLGLTKYSWWLGDLGVSPIEVSDELNNFCKEKVFGFPPSGFSKVNSYVIYLAVPSWLYSHKCDIVDVFYVIA